MAKKPTQANIRKFLFDHFTKVELRKLASDYFPPVESKLTSRLTKKEIILQLLTYCKSPGQFDHLIKILGQEKSASFQQLFELESQSQRIDQSHKRTDYNPNKIFISHSSQDRALAGRIAKELRRNGYETWIAPDNIKPGEKWISAIDRGLRESGIFIALITQAALDSEWVGDEITNALESSNKGKVHFFPLKVQNEVEVPFYLSARHWIEFSKFTDSNFEILLEKLEATKPIEPNKGLQDEIDHGGPILARAWLTGSIGLVTLVAVLYFAISAFLDGLSPYCGNIMSDSNFTTRDIDNDGLCDGYELSVSRTDPYLADTDGDGISDLHELEANIDPNSKTDLESPINVPGFDDNEWIKIPNGVFYIGAAEDDKDAKSDAIKSDLKEIADDKAYSISYDYWIAKHELTNAQYKLFVEETGHPAPSCEESENNIWTKAFLWREADFPIELETHPVECVSWNDAVAYVEWLDTKLLGLGFHAMLPSEPEWEKAARGIEDQRIFPWGEWEELEDADKEDQNEFLNFCDINCDYSWNDDSINDGWATSAPVGSYSRGASPFGVMDMAGNVSEWTRSKIKEYDYPVGTLEIENREDLESDSRRIIRGGGWSIFKSRVRVSVRLGGWPDEGIEAVGIRVVIRQVEN